MRHEMKKIEDVRAVFTGIFVRLGSKPGWRGRMEETVLLKDIREGQGCIVANHLWFNRTVGFAKLALVEGDAVRFCARVKPYRKGYMGRREDVYDAPVERDYKLSHPTKVEKITSLPCGAT